MEGVTSAASSCRVSFLTGKRVHGIVSCFRVLLLQVYAARVAMGLRLAKRIARQVPIGEVKGYGTLFALVSLSCLLVSCDVPCAMGSGGRIILSVFLLNEAGRPSGVSQPLSG